MTTETWLRLRLLSAAMLLTLTGALAVPAATFASCVLPNYAVHMQDPNSVIVAGTILQVGPQQVTVTVQKWWGAGAAQSVVIQRPPTDPNVISPVDWNPQPGEAWIIFAHRAGAGLSSDVCGQWTGTPERAQEVAAALGAGIVPGPPADTTAEPVTSDGLGLLALAFLGLALLVAGGAAFAITRMRRSG